MTRSRLQQPRPFFALLFATYGVMLPAMMGGPMPASEYKMGPAFLEMPVLLTSSFTFGMASVAIKHDQSRTALPGWLGVTLALGLAFLGLELHDLVMRILAEDRPLIGGCRLKRQRRAVDAFDLGAQRLLWRTSKEL